MKIALVSPYDFVYPGGVANHVTALERCFTGKGHEVKIIAPASKPITGFDGRFIQIGRPLAIPSKGTIVRVPLSLNLGATIKEVLKREKFDIIHLHEPFMPMLCSAILRFSETANVGTFHACQGSPGYNLGKPVSTILLKRRARKLHGRIAVSQAALNFACRYVPGCYSVIPNGVDVGQFSPDVAPVERYCDGKLNILFVGRLESRKGVDYLVRAYQQVKKAVPDSRLIIVGPGTRLRRKYEKEAAQSGLKDVVFTGLVRYDELPGYYRTADVFCAPATGRESFGIVLLEAMAAGTPIVASDIEGYASVLSDGVEGLLVPPKDADSLARSLISLLNDAALRRRMGEAGRLKANEYSWERVSERVFSYYLQVLNEPLGLIYPPEPEESRFK